VMDRYRDRRQHQAVSEARADCCTPLLVVMAIAS
jgi:hypothetical protein